jgi:glycosyltransferase involved in cell wall biosynthesis
MRIFHGLQNIGGKAGLLAKAQRRFGVDAMSFCTSTGSFNFPADKILLRTKWSRFKLLIIALFKYNVFQFYFDSTFTGYLLWELPILKLLRKKIFFYFCGCDVRNRQLTIEKYQYSACKECFPPLCSPNREKIIASALKYADGIFVSTPDLLEFVSGSKLLPPPVELSRLEQLRNIPVYFKSDKIRIAHAPTNEAIKGTAHIKKAIAQLQKEGYPLEFIFITGKSHEECIHKTAEADIVVDQVLLGVYGIYAAESMAMGKPVICYIREDLRSHYHADLPIISAHKDNLVDVLKSVIEQRNRWSEWGNQGMEYVKKNHSSEVIAKKMIEAYHNYR